MSSRTDQEQLPGTGIVGIEARACSSDDLDQLACLETFLKGVEFPVFLLDGDKGSIAGSVALYPREAHVGVRVPPCRRKSPDFRTPSIQAVFRAMSSDRQANTETQKTILVQSKSRYAHCLLAVCVNYNGGVPGGRARWARACSVLEPSASRASRKFAAAS